MALLRGGERVVNGYPPAIIHHHGDGGVFFQHRFGPLKRLAEHLGGVPKLSEVFQCFYGKREGTLRHRF